MGSTGATRGAGVPARRPARALKKPQDRACDNRRSRCQSDQSNRRCYRQFRQRMRIEAAERLQIGTQAEEKDAERESDETAGARFRDPGRLGIREQPLEGDADGKRTEPGAKPGRKSSLDRKQVAILRQRVAVIGGILSGFIHGDCRCGCRANPSILATGLGDGAGDERRPLQWTPVQWPWRRAVAEEVDRSMEIGLLSLSETDGGCFGRAFPRTAAGFLPATVEINDFNGLPAVLHTFPYICIRRTPQFLPYYKQNQPVVCFFHGQKWALNDQKYLESAEKRTPAGAAGRADRNFQLCTSRRSQRLGVPMAASR